MMLYSARGVPISPTLVSLTSVSPIYVIFHFVYSRFAAIGILRNGTERNGTEPSLGFPAGN